MKLIAPYFIIAALFLVLLPHAASGQFGAADLGIEMTPRLPGAHEDVELQLSGFAVDLDRSEIFWYVDDEVRAGGVGERSFAFTTGELGVQTEIGVAIRTPEGAERAQTFTVVPAEVDILWEAHSYAPPFYKGKVSPASKGLIKFDAVPQFVTPDGERVSPSEIIYTWEQDGAALGRISGYGRQSIVLEAKTVERDRTTISVTASSFSGALRAKKTVSIRTARPSVIFYEKHPLEGVRLEKALGGRRASLWQGEKTIRAEPYFFSLDDIAAGRLAYDWELAGRAVKPTAENPREVVIRRAAGTAGTLELFIENTARVLQDARAVLAL